LLDFNEVAETLAGHRFWPIPPPLGLIFLHSGELKRKGSQQGLFSIFEELIIN
jgi:hypothetical protein